MYGFNKVGGGALFNLNPNPLRRRLNPVLRCFSSRQRRRRPCESRERKELPPEISRNTARLTCESYAHGRVCDVYLIGTRHDCPESSPQVKAVIEFLKPQAVILELCPSRVDSVLGPPDKEEEHTLVDLWTEWRRRGNFYQAWSGWFGSKELPLADLWAGWRITGNYYHAYSGWSQSKALKKLQNRTNEFRVAYEEAIKCGAMVFFCERDVNITMARAWIGTPLWEKTLLVFSGLSYPSIYVEKALLHERDQYMSAEILNISRKYNSVVAVVGRGHLRGIQENWKKPVNLEQLCIMPQKKRMTVGKKILTSVGVAVAGFCGIYLSIKIYHSTIST